MPLLCHSCGYSNRLASGYCASCGRPIRPTRMCLKCSVANPSGHRYCDHCGIEFDNRDEFNDALFKKGNMPGLFSWERISTKRMAGSRTIFALLTLTIVFALFVRCSGLETTSHQFSKSEQMLSQSIHDVVTFGWIGLWSKDLGGQPTGVAYLMSAWVRVVDDDGLGLRFVFVVVGLLTMVIVFVFCRRFFGARVGILAVVFLALSAWHIQFSRMALLAAFLPIFWFSIVYLIVSGLEDADPDKGIRTIGLAGVLAGAGFYIHNAYWILVIAMGILWAWEFLSGKTPSKVLSRKASVFWFLLLITALPYLSFLMLNGTDVLNYLREVFIFGEVEFKDRNGIPEQSRYVFVKWVQSTVLLLGRFDVMSTLLAVIGFVVGITRFRERSYILLWVLVPITTLAVALTVGDGVQSRMMSVLPVVTIMAGVGLDWLLTWTKGRFTLVAQFVLVALVMLFIAWVNLASFYSNSVVQDGEMVVRNPKIGDRWLPLMLFIVPTESTLTFKRQDHVPFQVRD